MCRITSATASGWCASTALAIASGGPITSHGVPKPRSNSSRKRRNRWMCLASSAANPSSARTAYGSSSRLRPRVVEHEGQDELLDEAEHVEVAVAADLVERQPLAGPQEVEPLDAGERLRQERLREVEPLVAADQVLDPPVDPLRRCQCRLVRVPMSRHRRSPFAVLACNVVPNCRTKLHPECHRPMRDGTRGYVEPLNRRTWGIAEGDPAVFGGSGIWPAREKSRPVCFRPEDAAVR